MKILMTITMELLIQKMIIQMMRATSTIPTSLLLKMGVLLTGIMMVFLVKTIMKVMDGLTK